MADTVYSHLAVVAYGVDGIRPWHKQAAQLCGVPVNPQGVAYVGKEYGCYYQQCCTNVLDKVLERGIIYASGKQVYAWRNAKEQYVQCSYGRDEFRCLGKAGVEHVAHHHLCDEHFICVYEIQAYGVGNET